MDHALDRILRLLKNLFKHGDSDIPEKHIEPYRKSIRAIEDETDHRVSIATTTTPENLQSCYTQDQSPLFALPAEIRTLIFSYALTPNPWQDSFDAQLFHPTDRFSLQILQTCRRVWLEANSLVFEHARPELHLYGTNTFGEFEEVDYEATVRGMTELDRFLKKLTPNNIERMHLNVLATRVILGKHTSLRRFAICPAQWPRHVTITFRIRQITHSSVIIAQQHPESMTMLEIMADLLRHGAIVGIRRLVFRMEALAEKRQELERSFDEILGAASRGELSPDWNLDRERCQGSREDGRLERSHIEVAVLEWYRIADDPVSDKAGKKIGLGSGQGTEASDTVLRDWQQQGSLLRFIV